MHEVRSHQEEKPQEDMQPPVIWEGRGQQTARGISALRDKFDVSTSRALYKMDKTRLRFSDLGWGGSSLELADDFPYSEFFDFVQEHRKHGVEVTLKGYPARSGESGELNVRFEVTDREKYKAYFEGKEKQQSVDEGERETRLEDIKPGLLQLKTAIEARRDTLSRASHESWDAVAGALHEIIREAADVTAVQKGPDGQESPLISSYAFPATETGDGIPSFDRVVFTIPLRDAVGRVDSRTSAASMIGALNAQVPQELREVVRFGALNNEISLTLKVKPESIDGIATERYKRRQIESHAKKKAAEYTAEQKAHQENKAALAQVTKLVNSLTYDQFRANLAEVDMHNQNLAWLEPVPSLLRTMLDTSVLFDPRRSAQLIASIQNVSSGGMYGVQERQIQNFLIDELKNTTFRSVFDRVTIYTDDQVDNMRSWIGYLMSEQFKQYPGGRVDTYQLVTGNGGIETHDIDAICQDYLAVLDNPKKYKNGLPDRLVRCLPFSAKQQLEQYIARSKRFKFF